ncbi:zinc ribbon domain-containing protein [Schaalia vaccimaxillae]|uniref:zinc ribbon domain-containing protein n=1 Tax=Schaalia vaccimaxillae TaxID=183916 RepID=UPI0003B68990|nr:hypothetical protein [Schaalia vaccimaxillae]
MKVSHNDQLLLLDLQNLDQRESSLRHRRDSHPAHTTVRELAGRAEDLQRAAIAQSAVISDIGREITRIEDEIDKVRARRARQSARIENNEVPLRDIASMEHEIAQMDLRLSKLENDQIDAEERRESAIQAMDAMNAEGQAIRADVEETKARFADDVKESDEELREVIAKRRELAERIDAGLVDEYERSRKANGALAVLEVRDGHGIGIAADLPPLELERIRMAGADEVYWTEDSQQIVVRTFSS